MDIRQYWLTFRKWAWLIVLLMIMATGLGVYLSRTSKPVYSTTTVVAVTLDKSITPLLTASSGGDPLGAVFSEILLDGPAFSMAAQQVGLRTTPVVNVQSRKGTAFLELTAQDSNPQHARDFVNALVEAHNKLSRDQQTSKQQAAQQATQKQLSDLEDQIRANTTKMEALRATAQNNLSDVARLDAAAQQQQQTYNQLLTDAHGVMTPQLAQLADQLRNTSAQRERVRADAQNNSADAAQLQAAVGQLQAHYADLLRTTDQAVATDGTPTDPLSVVRVAPLPSKPIHPNLTQDVPPFTAGGLLVGAGMVFLIEYLTDSVKTQSEVEQLTELPALGVIMRLPRQARRLGNLLQGVGSFLPAQEAYRVLRTNVDFVGNSLVALPERVTRRGRQDRQSRRVGLPGRHARSEESRLLDAPVRPALPAGPASARGQVFLITSPGKSEGKSTTLANLAAAVAQSGRRVIIVDSDMRRPTQHEIFGLDNSIGLSSLLAANRRDFAPAIRFETAVPNVTVVPSGPIPPNPTELLSSAAMRWLIEDLRSTADVVLMDSASVLAVADPSLLGAQSDGVVLVARARKTRKGELKAATETLRRSSVPLIGVVLNDVRGQSRGSYYASSKKAESDNPYRPQPRPSRRRLADYARPEESGWKATVRRACIEIGDVLGLREP